MRSYVKVVAEEEPERKRPLDRSRYKWKNNIKMNIK
jgi:hypothetical protein